MEKAQLITRDGSRVVSAQEFQLLFHGILPSRARLLCPLCQQRVIPVSMGRNGKQSPHFKHERNNELAHECDLYAQSLGKAKGYEKAPMPMFLRHSKKQPGSFIMELGFKKLPESTIRELAASKARIVIGRKTYNVTTERFGSGITKIPVDKPTLEVGESVRLEGTKRKLYETWGRPESAVGAMIFSCDPASLCGNRLRPRDGIENDSLILIAAPPYKKEAIEKAFPSVKDVGKASVEPGYNDLRVFLAYLNQSEPSFEQARSFLLDCGFSVVEKTKAPRVVWPPCLSSSGEHHPLIRNRRLVFLSPKAALDDGFIYASYPELEECAEKRLPLFTATNKDFGYAMLRTDSDIAFVSASKSFAASTVLSDGDLGFFDSLAKAPEPFAIEGGPSGWVDLACPAKCEIVREMAGAGVLETIRVDECPVSSLKAPLRRERLKILVSLTGSKGGYAAATFAESLEGGAGETACSLDELLPANMKRALAREAGVKYRKSRGPKTKSHAKAREERRR